MYKIACATKQLSYTNFHFIRFGYTHSMYIVNYLAWQNCVVEVSLKIM